MRKPSQKPIDKRGRKENKEALWKAIRKKKEFTLADVAKNCTLREGTIAIYLRSLVRAGYLSESLLSMKGANGQGEGFRKPLKYKLIKDRHEPPRVREDGSEITQGKATQRMWNTIRKRKTFILADMRALSSTTEGTVSDRQSEGYLRYLEKAGYVRNTNGKYLPYAVFRLIRDTGPKAPMIQRIKQVWDPNLRKVMWPMPKANSNE